MKIELPKKNVCTIVVTHNRVETLKKSLACLKAQTAELSIIVVNNNSSDGTEEYLKSIKTDSGIDFVNVRKDIGFAAGLATGVEFALEKGDYDYFWFVEDDSFYDDNILEKLLTNMEGSEFHYLGLDEKPTPLFLYNGRTKSNKETMVTGKPQEADFVMIDGALIKVELVLKIGPPAKKLFMMCEEDEYCMRLKKHGFKAGYLNISNLNRLHLGGDGKFTRSTLWRGYYQSRNSILLLKEYFSFMSLLGFTIRQTRFLVAAALFAPDKFQRIKLRFWGIWHGIRGLEGKTLDPDTLRFER